VFTGHPKTASFIIESRSKWSVRFNLHCGSPKALKVRIPDCPETLTAAKAAQLAAQKPALDVTTTAQLRDLALTMARLCGCDGKSQASATVNTAVQTGVVITEKERMRLIAQRKPPPG
jgi:hypothetical protein